MTDDVVRWHLSGQDPLGAPFVMGVYLLLLDETCFFLPLDFDGEAWMDDANAFRGACRTIGLPIALERSRTGNEGHFWLFFAEEIPAALARRLGFAILSSALESRPEIGPKSYDRLFPNPPPTPRGKAKGQRLRLRRSRSTDAESHV